MAEELQVQVMLEEAEALSVSAAMEVQTVEVEVEKEGQPPQFSSALSFNGTDQYVDTGITPPEVGYLEVTVKPVGNISQIIGGRDGTNSRCSINNGTGNVYGASIGADVSAVTSTVPIEIGVWRTIRLTWDGVTVRLFVDGVEEDSAPQNGSVGSILPLYVGCWNSKGAVAGFSDVEIAHASINGVSIPFNNETPYDLTYDTEEKAVVNFINDPVQTTQKVVHKEFEYGYFAAVRGDGATGAIDSGVSMEQVTSTKFRFIVPPEGNDTLMGVTESEVDVDARWQVYLHSTLRIIVYLGADLISIEGKNAGDEVTIEMHNTGEVIVDDVSHGFTGTLPVFTGSTLHMVFSSRNISGVIAQHTNSIILQAWVNGQEIDIHDQSKWIGTVSEHRLIDYP